MTRSQISTIFRNAWFLLVLSALVGCANLGGGKLTPEELAAEDEWVIRDRVQARWDAFLAKEFEKVYGYASPIYRKTYDFRHFSNQYAMQIQRTGIEIYKVEFDSEDPNVAKVVVLLSFLTEGAVGHVYEGVSRVVETWIKQDGQWWHVEQR